MIQETERGMELQGVIHQLTKLKDELAPDIDLGLKFKKGDKIYSRANELVEQGLSCPRIWRELKLRTLLKYGQMP